MKKNKRGQEWGKGWDGKSRVPDNSFTITISHPTAKGHFFEMSDIVVNSYLK
jgi:hypothetical protein